MQDHLNCQFLHAHQRVIYHQDYNSRAQLSVRRTRTVHQYNGPLLYYTEYRLLNTQEFLQKEDIVDSLLYRLDKVPQQSTDTPLRGERYYSVAPA
jgi:hypothetical protein